MTRSNTISGISFIYLVHNRIDFIDKRDTTQVSYKREKS